MKLIVKRFEELSIDELYEILQVRFAVFIVEQNCIYPEVDGRDQESYHVYLKDDTGIKAYLRVVDKGVSHEEVSIGRVLTTERGIGLGKRILSEGIKVAKERMNADKIVIEAQSYAKEYYEKAGFMQVSEEFMEDGIPHIKMVLEV
ncbi:GNAT family N-acetyltransferase [Gudongella sp. DL1XJH-153]|uniref:GNAT family N-acetyltransferase n=1 Tax=Gudongella sp. DL1XJH-153 TaxID=3409804 RepID=UPI003BB79228